MSPPRLLLVVVLAGSLFVAGCGGTTTYSADKSRACLVKKGLKVAAPTADDFVASAAEGDAFSVRFPGNVVTVSFGLDRKGAERIVRAYERFRGKNIGLADVLHAKHNAVMLWAAHPKDEHVGTIEGCLK